MKHERLKYALAAIAVIAAMLLVFFFSTTTAHAQELPRCTTDPTEPCNLSASGYDLILEDTELHGIGETLESGEKLYGINGLFIAAIIAHESGWGTSQNAKDKNNLGGIKGADGYRTFYNKQICILYMFSLLDRRYIAEGRDTVEEIAERYCVPPEHWEKSVTEILEELIDRSKDTQD